MLMFYTIIKKNFSILGIILIIIRNILNNLLYKKIKMVIIDLKNLNFFNYFHLFYAK